MFPAMITDSILYGMGLTIIVYCLAECFIERFGIKLLPPMFFACPTIVLMLMYVPELSYEKYARGADFINFLLGPATIALAVPLYRNWKTVQKYALPLGIGVVFSSVLSVSLIYFMGKYLGVSEQLLLSLLPKSVTAPIAIEITKPLGGLPPITTAAVISSGVLGAIINHSLLRMFHVKSDVACGLAIGACSHGLGTSVCVNVSSVQLAVGGVSIGLCGLASSVLIPLLYPILKSF